MKIYYKRIENFLKIVNNKDMKKLSIIFFIFLFTSLQAMAVYPENEAEFLYNHKDNSTIRVDYLNSHIYTKGPDNSYFREDGAIIYKGPAGIIENSKGTSYMPVGGGSMYVPMNL